MLNPLQIMLVFNFLSPKTYERKGKWLKKIAYFTKLILCRTKIVFTNLLISLRKPVWVLWEFCNVHHQGFCKTGALLKMNRRELSAWDTLLRLIGIQRIPRPTETFSNVKEKMMCNSWLCCEQWRRKLANSFILWSPGNWGIPLEKEQIEICVIWYFQQFLRKRQKGSFSQVNKSFNPWKILGR